MTAAPIERPHVEPPEQAPRVLSTSRLNQVCPHCRHASVLLIGGADIPLTGECSNCGQTPTPGVVRAYAKMRRNR